MATNLITYKQLQDATVESLAKDPQLLKVFASGYSASAGRDPQRLLGYWQSGANDFNKAKSRVLSDRSPLFRDLRAGSKLSYNYDRYKNWSGGTNIADSQAAEKEKAKGIQAINSLKTNLTNLGFDPLSHSTFSSYYSGFGLNTPTAAGITPTETALASAPAQPTSQSGSIPFKQGLSTEQQQSIRNLMAARPSSLWTETDKKNWAYATNNAPLPASGSAEVKPANVGAKVSNPAELTRLGQLGLTERDLTRVGADIYVKPDSPYYNKVNAPPRAEGETIETYTERVAAGATTGGSSIGTSEAVRKEARDKILAEISPKGGLPELPSIAEERIRLRREQGVLSDEQDLADIRADARAAQEEIRQFRATASAGVSMGGFTGAVSEAERNAMFRVEGLALQEQALVERINAKNSFIDQSIRDMGTDYNAAVQKWNMEYGLNLQATSILNTQLEQDKKDAIATASTITNLMSESGVPYEEWPTEMKMASEKAALALGLPKETFGVAFQNLGEGEKVLSTTIQPNEQGGMDAWVITQNKKGEIGVVKAGAMPGATAGGQDLGDYLQNVAAAMQISQFTGDPSWFNAAVGGGGGPGGGKLNYYNTPEENVAGQNASPAEFRTVRNNNPIAVTTASVYTSALDRAGIDWYKGDPFSGGITVGFTTPEEGWEGARAILADSPAVQDWYINHTGKAVFAQYGIKNNKDFAKLDAATQDRVIMGVFAAENGTTSRNEYFDAAASNAPKGSSQMAAIGADYLPTLPSRMTQASNSKQEEEHPWESNVGVRIMDLMSDPFAKDAAEDFKSRLAEENRNIISGKTTREQAFNRLHGPGGFQLIRPSDIWAQLNEDKSPANDPKVKAALSELDELEQQVQQYYNDYTKVVKSAGTGGPLVGTISDWLYGTGLGLRLPGIGDIKLPPFAASLSPQLNALYNDADTLAAKLGQTVLQTIGASTTSGGSKSPTYFRDLGMSLVPTYKDPLNVVNRKFAEIKRRVDERRRSILGSGYAGSDFNIQPVE